MNHQFIRLASWCN